MQYTVHYPSSAFNFLINKYIFLYIGKDERQFTEKYIPDGHLAIVCNFCGTVKVSDGSNHWTLPSYFLVKPTSRSLYINISEAPETMVIVFKSSVFTRFFNLKIEHHSKTPFQDIKGLFPEELYFELQSSECQQNRIHLIETFLLQMQYISYQPDEIDNLYLRIINEKGIAQINKLLGEYHLNPRSFRRNFLSRVGVCAKTLSRIVRINYLWSSFLSNNNADIQSMIYNGQYFDQSHLIRDFKKIIGESPNRFFSRDQEKIRFISGK